MLYHSSIFETFIKNVQLLQFDYSTCPLIVFVCCSVKTQFDQDLYLGCELVSGQIVHFSQLEGEFWCILNLFLLLLCSEYFCRHCRADLMVRHNTCWLFLLKTQ